MLQFGVSRGRGYPSEVVAEFELKTSVPRQRDRSHSARSEERLHEDGVEGSTTLSDAVDALKELQRTLSQHGHGGPEEFHEKALRGQAASHSNTVEVGLHYWYS